VIGTIAALTNNSLGVSGVNWGGYGIKVMPIRVLGADGSGTLDNVAAGIRWAADHGANIISMSLGGSGDSSTHGCSKVMRMVKMLLLYVQPEMKGRLHFRILLHILNYSGWCNEIR